MNDLDALYNEIHDSQYTQLQEAFAKQQEAFPEFTSEKLVRDFIKQISFERENLIEKHTPNDPFANSYKTKRNLFKEKLVEVFPHAIKNYTKNEVTNFIKHDLPDIRLKHKHDKEKGGVPNNYSFDPEFLEAEDETIVSFLANYFAYDNYIKELYKKYLITESSEYTQSDYPTLKWTSSAQVDFIKLIYGLHHAGFINHGRGEITKIIPYLMDVFNVKLKDWPSSHSSAFNKAAADYDIYKVFDTVKKSYKNYVETQIEKEK